MKIVQKGGYVLETEEAFFEWLENDSNIEDLLKSTLQFLEYKTKVANALVKDSMDELNQYWKSKLMTRIQTKKTVQKSFDDALIMIKADSLSKSIVEKKDLTTADIQQLTTMAYSVQGTAEGEGQKEEGIYLSRLSAQINQTQTLKDLYMAQKKAICLTYFAKKSTPEKYKEALQSKRTAIREKVNQFIESFTGESNRRHRLYILNYAIDFAQNWTSFQGNYKLNLLITGGAGLGKTTFAKAIGKLFFEFGLLARDLFQIREKTDFIGQYIGQTPMKTYSTLYSALESMIFIDEAYSVSGCGTGGTHDYGQEFIDALVDVSQKTRGLISIVAAGYKAEMHNCFLDKNPGMRRRFPNELELTPYSSIDLDNILTNNVLRPIFSLQLNSVLKTDLLKEPEIYFQNPTKYKEFGKEILLRLPEFGRDDALVAFLQSYKQPGTMVKKAEGEVYQGLLNDAKRGESLKKISHSKIQDYSLIFRYRTKIIGLYRFFMQLASFDTNFPSFEAMYGAHQFLWKMVTDNNPNHTYKYNNYRIMHLIYLSSHQQRREIMKSFLLRRYYSEKEGSLFPNQAGDMDTLAAFIKSQPNIRLNVMPTFEEVTKLYNEYFRSRGGSRFILRATKADDSIELFIYHIGGGFINYTDFEEGVLSKIFKGFTYDGKTVSALWDLNAQTPEHRDLMIRKINSFYSQACVSLLRDAKESLKTYDSNEKNEKRLPSGIDIRFLEAEAMSFLSANQGVELGDDANMKYLEYVSSGEVSDSDDEIRGILGEITQDTESVEALKSLSLNEAILCKDFVVPEKLAVLPPLQVAERVVPDGPGAPKPKASDEEREKALRLLEAAAKKTAAVVPAPALPLVPALPALPLGAPPPINPALGDARYPLKTLRVFIEERKRGPSDFLRMTPIIPMTRIVGQTEIPEEYKLTLSPLPHRIPENDERRSLLSQGYHFFLVEWTKGQGSADYRGQGFVYLLKESKQCSLSVPLFKKKGIPKRFYEFTYLGRLDEIYPGLDSATQGIRTFTKGAALAPPVAPPGVPPLSVTKTGDPDKELKAKLDKIYPPSRLELASYKTKLKEGSSDAWLDQYKKTKALQYAQESRLDLQEPLKLYYHGPPIQEFSELVEKDLSFAKEYPELFVARILSLEEVDDEPTLTIEDEKGTETIYRIFKVEYIFGKGDSSIMNPGSFYYGLKVTNDEKPLNYPLEFTLLEIEDEEEEGAEETKETNELGEVEFEDKVALAGPSANTNAE